MRGGWTRERCGAFPMRRIATASAGLRRRRELTYAAMTTVQINPS
jgi:hypothetical protein